MRVGICCLRAGSDNTYKSREPCCLGVLQSVTQTALVDVNNAARASAIQSANLASAFLTMTANALVWKTSQASQACPSLVSACVVLSLSSFNPEYPRPIFLLKRQR